MMKYSILISAFAFLILVLGVSVMPPFGVNVPLLFLFAIAQSFLVNFKTSLKMAFISGFLFDLFSPLHLGLLTLVFLATVFILSFYQKVFGKSFLSFIFASLIASLLLNLIPSRSFNVTAGFFENMFGFLLVYFISKPLAGVLDDARADKIKL